MTPIDQQVMYVEVAQELRKRGIMSQPMASDMPGTKNHLAVLFVGGNRSSQVEFYLPISFDYHFGEHEAAVQWTTTEDGDFLGGEIYHVMPTVREVVDTIENFYVKAVRHLYGLAHN